MAALLPRCEGGTYKHCFKNAYVISCLFSSPNKKSFIFLQNQNIQLQQGFRDVISTRQLSWALFIFAVVVWKIQKRWSDRRRSVCVDWRCGLWLQCSCWNVSYVNQCNEAFPFSNEGARNTTGVVENKFKIGTKQKRFIWHDRKQLRKYTTWSYCSFAFHETIITNCWSSTRALPLAMWALKLGAVSSYMPCLGSGALGGSISLSGSWRKHNKHVSSMNLHCKHHWFIHLKLSEWTPLTEGSSWSIFSIQVSRDCRSLGPWYFTASWSGLNSLSLHVTQKCFELNQLITCLI